MAARGEYVSLWGASEDVGKPCDAERCEPSAERVARGIASRKRSSGLASRIELGKYVATELYAGNLAPWRKRHRAERRFKQLASHPELPVGREELYRCVETYELSVRIPLISTSKHFESSYVQELRGLSHAAQLALVERIDRATPPWTVAELRRQVSLHRLALAAAAQQRQAPKAGRPKSLPVVKTLNQLGKLDAESFRGVQALKDCNERTRGEHCKTLTFLIEALTKLKRVIGGIELGA